MNNAGLYRRSGSRAENVVSTRFDFPVIETKALRTASFTFRFDRSPVELSDDASSSSTLVRDLQALLRAAAATPDLYDEQPVVAQQRAYPSLRVDRPVYRSRRPVTHCVRRLCAVPLGIALAVTIAGLAVPMQAANADGASGAPAMKMMNYFPARYSQGAFWTPTNWSPSTYSADFALIRSLGGDTVRIFVPSDQFGYPTPKPTYVTELSQMISIASQRGLRVYLNIFNYNGHFSDVQGSETWAGALLKPYAGDRRLAAVEVFNEIDPTNSQAMSWAQQLIPFVQQVVKRPVSISTGGFANSQVLASLHDALGGVQPDFYDWHYYCTAGDAVVSLINQAKQAVAPVPMIVGEAGFPTGLKGTDGVYVSTSGSSGEDQQASAIKQFAQAIAQASGVGTISPWVLYDFAPTPGSAPSNEYYFGLYRFDGSAKPAVSALKAAWA